MTKLRRKIQICNGLSNLFFCTLGTDVLQQFSNQEFKALAAVADLQAQLLEEVLKDLPENDQE
jgi:hypothetical protein